MSLPFLELGTNLINKSGFAGYIASSQWISTDYGKAARAYMSEERIDKIVNFGTLPVFGSVSTYPAIFILRGKPRKSLQYTEVKNTSYFNLKKLRELKFMEKEFVELDSKSWTFEKINLRSLLSQGKATLPLSEWGIFISVL